MEGIVLLKRSFCFTASWTGVLHLQHDQRNMYIYQSKIIHILTIVTIRTILVLGVGLSKGFAHHHVAFCILLKFCESRIKRMPRASLRVTLTPQNHDFNLRGIQQQRCCSTQYLFDGGSPFTSGLKKADGGQWASVTSQSFILDSVSGHGFCPITDESKLISI